MMAMKHQTADAVDSSDHAENSLMMMRMMKVDGDDV